MKRFVEGLDRGQATLFPECLDDWIDEDNPVRVIDAFGIILQGLCALFAIAFVHSDNRLAASLMIGLFSIGIAVSAVMIVAYDRPFTGEFAVSPDPLLQVMPPADARSVT